jgi:hypothetical protein
MFVTKCDELLHQICLCWISITVLFVMWMDDNRVQFNLLGN